MSLPDYLLDPPDPEPPDCEPGEEGRCYEEAGRVCRACRMAIQGEIADTLHDLRHRQPRWG